MKKKLLPCLALLAFSLLSAGTLWAQQYYPGDGWATALYIGTTKEITLERLYAGRRAFFLSDNSGHVRDLRDFNGKLSKRQSRLLWDALKEYDYAPGELYTVIFTEAYDPNFTYFLSVQIEADRSATWMGFTYEYMP